MNNLHIKETGTTPSVEFDCTTGILKLEGRSIPENPDGFYEDILQWIHGYFRQPAPLTKMEINLEYVNSGTSKYLMEMFRIMKDYHDTGKKIAVNWHYEEEDESMYDLGKHYQDSVDLPIRLMIIY